MKQLTKRLLERDDLAELALPLGSRDPVLRHPPEIRRGISTTYAIESLNMARRKVTKTRSSFPNDEAVLKLLYLAVRNIAKNMDHTDP